MARPMRVSGREARTLTSDQSEFLAVRGDRKRQVVLALTAANPSYNLGTAVPRAANFHRSILVGVPDDALVQQPVVDIDNEERALPLGFTFHVGDRLPVGRHIHLLAAVLTLDDFQAIHGG
jgi:hypothetical protein